MCFSGKKLYKTVVCSASESEVEMDLKGIKSGERE